MVLGPVALSVAWRGLIEDAARAYTQQVNALHSLTGHDCDKFHFAEESYLCRYKTWRQGERHFEFDGLGWFKVGVPSTLQGLPLVAP